MTNAVKKAHIKFCKFEGQLAIQVLYMDERFRCRYKEKSISEVHLSFPFRICSSNTPDFDGQNLFLHGSELIHDSKVTLFKIDFETGVVVYGLFKALKDWAKNWEGWKDEPAIEPIITEYEGGVVEVVV